MMLIMTVKSTAGLYTCTGNFLTPSSLKLLKRSKSINLEGCTPQLPKGGYMICTLTKFFLKNSFSPLLGGQPRSGRGFMWADASSEI